MSGENVGLVAGALGVVGRAAITHIAGLDVWRAIGLSRRAPDFELDAEFLSVDLTDPADCEAKLSGLSEVTHVFYAAYAPAATLAEEAVLNKAMLVNLLQALEPNAPGLRHVQIVQGSKWYGNHLGPYKTPASEADPPHMPPNFYFDQQDWLVEQRKGKRWTWSALRPHGVCGLAIGSSMNQLTAMALYASISKHLGLPLRFPGTPGAFNAVYQMTEADYLARGMAWAATNPACADQAFNFTNGDFIRWCNLWPKIARFFDMDPGPVQTISLSEFMADKEPLWAELRRRHDLKPYTLAELTNWRFADFVFGVDYDQMSAMTKARNAGWTGENDSEAMYIRLLRGLREQGIIP